MVLLSPNILPKSFPKSLAGSLLDRARFTRHLAELGRRARHALGTQLGARYVTGLNGKAHYNDVLLASTARPHVEAYRRDAVEFVELLERALGAADMSWREVRACLDVGCGYGRIVRELKGKLPPRAISVCDVLEEAAHFTSLEFGAREVPIVEAMGQTFHGRFDLIYLLSLYTRLDRPMIEMNLAKVSALTHFGGLVVFTTLGRPTHESYQRYDSVLYDKARLDVELEWTGFVHDRHAFHRGERGLTFMLPQTVEDLVAEVAPDLSLIAHYPNAVDGREDVFVYRKM